jgi:TPR repeat protein
MMGCKYLGDMQTDHMIPPDRAARAARLYAEVCDRPKVAAVSDVSVCGALARLFLEGRGVPKDPRRAVEYYRKGCAVGDPASCEAAKAP